MLHMHASLWSCLWVSIFGPLYRIAIPNPEMLRQECVPISYSSFKTWILITNAPIQILALFLRSYVTLGNYLPSLWTYVVICELELRIVSIGKVVVEIKWQDACQSNTRNLHMAFSKCCHYIYKTFDGSKNIFSSTVFIKLQNQILCYILVMIE